VAVDLVGNWNTKRRDGPSLLSGGLAQRHEGLLTERVIIR
jgi:hypothetical protein